MSPFKYYLTRRKLLGKKIPVHRDKFRELIYGHPDGNFSENISWKNLLHIRVYEKGIIMNGNVGGKKIKYALPFEKIKEFEFEEENGLTTLKLEIEKSELLYFYFKTRHNRFVREMFFPFNLTGLSKINFENKPEEIIRDNLLRINSNVKSRKSYIYGILFLLGGIYFSYEAYQIWMGNGSSGLLVVDKQFFFLYVAGIFTFIFRALQFFSPDMNEVLRKDKRPPILFLRSFGDDYKHRESKSGSFLYFFDDEWRLSFVFKKYGPFIGIGKPGEALPNLGAHRKYVDDADWEDSVLSLMKISQAIVFKINYSDGLMREIEFAMRVFPKEHILFYFPYHLNMDKFLPTFQPVAKKILGQPFPESISHDSFFVFDEKGELIEIGRRKRLRWMYASGVRFGKRLRVFKKRL